MRPESTESKVDFRKQSYYFPGAMLSEIRSEASRQGRSISWVLQKAWVIAKGRVRAIPAPPV
jgi:uncharacterized small protein (TIGR04563 family)